MEIRKDENPDLDSHRLKTRFTYPNPKWAENERLGFSNFGVPGEEFASYRNKRTGSLYPGVWFITFFIPGLEIMDQTSTNDQPLPVSRIHLKPYQKAPFEIFLKKNQGLLVMPPGSGKTVVGHRDHSAEEAEVPGDWRTTKDLLEQWVERIPRPSRAATARSHRLRGGSTLKTPSWSASIQSLSRPLDHVPHASRSEPCCSTRRITRRRSSFQTVVSQFSARYRIGLTATPKDATGSRSCLRRLWDPSNTTWRETNSSTRGKS